MVNQDKHARVESAINSKYAMLRKHKSQAFHFIETGKFLHIMCFFHKAKILIVYIIWSLSDLKIQIIMHTF